MVGQFRDFTVFWYTLLLILLLLLPAAITRLHRSYYSNRLNALILQYRYFVLCNMMLLLCYIIIQLLLSLHASLLWATTISHSWLFLIIILLSMLTAVSVYLLLLDRVWCIVPAILNVIISMLIVLFMVFQFSQKIYFNLDVDIVLGLYAIIVAVCCFRYSCMVATYYKHTNEYGCAHISHI